MQVLLLAVKAGDVDGVKLLLESGARTDIQFPPQVGPGRGAGGGAGGGAESLAVRLTALLLWWGKRLSRRFSGPLVCGRGSRCRSAGSPSRPLGPALYRLLFWRVRTQEDGVRAL